MGRVAGTAHREEWRMRDVRRGLRRVAGFVRVSSKCSLSAPRRAFSIKQALGGGCSVRGSSADTSAWNPPTLSWRS